MTRKFSGCELVVATHNNGKLAEIEDILKGKNIKLFSAADLGLESPEETGTTFIENALLKARFVAEATGKIALGDDSGMCVEALDGAPGVYSADWAEIDGKRDFKRAMEKVHKAMGDNPNRKASFVSVLVLYWPDGHYETVEGVTSGEMVWPPRGAGGHGYDPMFLPDGHQATYAEIDAAEKNKISHRAGSMRKILEKCF